YAARGDMYTLFYELGVNLLNNRGMLTYITSNKWMRAGYGKKLRNYFINKTNPLILIDLGKGVFEHATVDTNILILSKNKYESSTTSLALSADDIQDEVSNNSENVEF